MVPILTQVTSDHFSYKVLCIVIHNLSTTSMDIRSLYRDIIFRLSFGGIISLEDPIYSFGDTDYIRFRFATDTNSAFAIEADGNLVGSNIVTNQNIVWFFDFL